MRLGKNGENGLKRIKKSGGRVYKSGTTVNRVVQYIYDKEKNKSKQKSFVLECKEMLFKNNEKMVEAIKDDKDDLEIIEIMKELIDSYDKETFSEINYEEAVLRHAPQIELSKAKELYPNIEKLREDFNNKIQQEIQMYSSSWIDDFRIKILADKNINSNISKLYNSKEAKTSDEILDYIIGKNPDIERMPNLYNAIMRRINEKIKKMDMSKKGKEI